LDKLSIKEIKANLESLEGWRFDSDQLKTSYKLNSFMEVMSFANLISDKSEKINHNPKIIIDYKIIEFNIMTHDISGISRLDFQLANFIHETYIELFIPNS